MAIVRWTDPFRDFAHLQERINRVFADAYGPADAGLLSASACSWNTRESSPSRSRREYPDGIIETQNLSTREPLLRNFVALCLSAPSR